MEINRALTRGDECAQSAALRQAILQYGQRIGWSRHTAIAFAEGTARRPWKRCTSQQLAGVVSELQDLHQACEVRRLVARIVFDGLRRSSGGTDADGV